MKRFIALSFIAMAMMQAWACGGWVRPNYYMFSVFNRNLMDNSFASQALTQWNDYTGNPDAEWDARYLDSESPTKFARSKNIIIKTAIKRNDTAMLNYLKLLVEYLNISEPLDGNWEYPTAAQLKTRSTKLESIKKRAMAGTGALKNRYALLVMRCNMTAGNHKANINYWNTTASRLKKDIYRDWMEDIYAGALFNTGQKDKACEIYAELGDMTSIKYCIRKKRNLNGIKEEYAANPNSPTLIFLVQDFVNNMQETLDNNSDREIMKWVEATGIYDADVKGFIAFAGKVLDEGKTKSPAMWEAARGFVNYMAGNNDVAAQQLKRATSLAGTQRMRDNARACLMLVTVDNTKQPTDEFFNHMTGEYKWLETMGREDAKGNVDDHYRDVYERITYDNMVPKLNEWGMTGLALALVSKKGLANVNEDVDALIDDLSSTELNDYNNYLRCGNHNAFEKWVTTGVTIDKDTFIDKMGTKLLREGSFETAVSYLEKVPLSLISNQGISYYMARKDYNTIIWFKRQFMNFLKEENTPVSRNAKLDFCRDMIALDKQIDGASGEQLNNLLYRKAALLYQASYRGDCWYLTHYATGVADTLRNREMDFAATAAQLLERVAKSTTNADLHQQCLFAQAFISGEATGYCIGSEFDWNTNTYSYYIDRDKPNYTNVVNLLKFNSANPGVQSDYLSKCDIIKKFKRLI